MWRALGSLQWWSCGGQPYPRIPKNKRWQEICGGPWAAFSGEAVEANHILEYQKIKGDKKYVEAQLAQS